MGLILWYSFCICLNQSCYGGRKRIKSVGWYMPDGNQFGYEADRERKSLRDDQGVIN